MRLLLTLSTMVFMLLIPANAGAGDVSQARKSLDEARLLIRNYHGEDASKILWKVFLNGESLSATELEIAEAAHMLVSANGGRDIKEERYLLTFAAEAKYPPAMNSLARTLLAGYRQSKTPKQHLEWLLEYPRIFKQEDALDLLRAAADAGEPGAMRSLANFYKKGQYGFLKDEVYAEELNARAFDRLVEQGRAGDHHKLITAARLTKSSEQSALLIDQAVEIGSTQVGGMDAEAASDLAMLLDMPKFKEDSAAARRQYEWLMHAANRVPPRLHNHYLQRIGEFLSGRGVIDSLNKPPIDIISAYAIFNYLNTRASYSIYKNRRDDLEEDITDEEKRASLTIARACMELEYIGCLAAIDANYKSSSTNR